MNDRQFAIDVVQKLQAAGFTALWAGGCVRDEFLGLVPDDYDVATSARPEQLRPLFRKRNEIGAHFGVVQVIGPKGDDGEWLTIEVATFRSDGAYTDGRRPDVVTFSSPEEDAKRRDFTINGMFFDPVRGELLDFVGGRDDLASMVLRAIGNPRERFTEDKLRILRAARMATRFELTIDPETHAAAVEMAPQVSVVSAERIAEELRKLFAHPNRARGLELLRDLGLLEPILPELVPHAARAVEVLWALRPCPPVPGCASRVPTPPAPLPAGRGEEELGAARAPSSRSDVEGLLSPLPAGRGAGGVGPLRAPDARSGSEVSFPLPLPLAFAAALHAVGVPAVEAIAARLKLATAETARITWLVGTQAALADAPNLPKSVLYPLLAHPGARELVALNRAVATSQGLDLTAVEHCEGVLRDVPAGALNPRPLVTGEDLIALGHKPGPAFKRWLDAARAAQFDGKVTTKEQALELVRRLQASP